MTEDIGDEPLSWDATGQPTSTRFGDVYFSKASGIDESRHVFLHHNDLPQRWLSLRSHQPFVIGETGFGTGLNFLVTWLAWRQTAPSDNRLHVVSAERYPLRRWQLARALALWPELEDVARELVEAYPPLPAAGFQQLSFDGGRVALTLIFDDALAGFRQLLPIARAANGVASSDTTWGGEATRVDAWYLDGFAPAKNPAMWTDELLDTLARLSTSGTTFATFTAAGAVKRGLSGAGFTVRKVQGFGRKRDMLSGVFTGARPKPVTTTAKPDTSWHLVPRPRPPSDDYTVTVIGAGLAGCHTARALAERGYTVTVLERDTVAAGASGNPQGIVYTKPALPGEPLTQVNIAALLYACRQYRDGPGFTGVGQPCGVLHVAKNQAQADGYRAIAQYYGGEERFVRWVEPSDTEAACGLPLRNGGLFFPDTGWMDPRALCRYLLGHPHITLLQGTSVTQLQTDGDHWLAVDDRGLTLSRSSQVVVAAAHEAAQFSQLSHLPLKPIRGQISTVAASPSSGALRAVLCGDGYIAPPINGQHSLGATFDVHDTAPEPRTTDDQRNLAAVAAFSDALRWRTVDSHRVAFRCASPDYLPLVGPAPDVAPFLERFGIYRHNRKMPVDRPGCYHPGLFINLAHGSRGLAYTPLCAAIIAAMITGEPLPLGRNLLLHLHPARFLVRDLARNRI